MEKPIAEITCWDYGECGISSEPSPEEIADAIAKGELEERDFQTDIDELRAEWYAKAREETSFEKAREKFARLARQYHARRTAYFVANPSWTDPLVLFLDNRIKDGAHRFRAAKYMRWETVSCEYVSD